MKKIKDAIDWIDIARMGYICDPNECGLEKGGDPCRAFHCDEIHDALVMAMDALKIADRLERAKPSVSVGATEPYSWLKNDSKTFNAYWEGVLVGYNQALAEIRGDTE